MKMRRAWAGIAAVATAALVGALGAAPVSAYAETVTVKTADELATAINAGNDVVLGDNITASVTVPADKTVTIDLGGHTLTAANKWAAITNNGNLTVTGSGTVDGAGVSQTAALYNAPTGTATLNAGTFTGSKWYVIKNLGDLTIDGASVVQKDAGTSGIDNGYCDNTGNDCGLTEPGSAEVKLTIKSGTFANGMNAVKNDDFGFLTVNGGTFTNTDGPAILNWNIAEINDGKFTASDGVDAVIANGAYAGTAGDQGKLTINGGTFTASKGGAAHIFAKGIGGTDGGAVSIKSGTFEGSLDNLDQLAIGVSVSGGAYTDVNVTKYVDADSATTSSLDMFVVGSADGVVDGSVAAVEVNGKKVYFDSVEAAENFAKENGADGEVLPVERTKHIVTYVANGKTVKTQTVKPGDALGTLPEAGEYEGYTFDGWYVDVTEGADGTADGTKIDETYKPTGDVTVTAMWTENTPSTPSTPSTPAAGSTDAQPAEAPKKALPQTGDTTNAALPVAIAIAGVVVIAAAVALRKRHN